ncbi:outer membrane protein/peptidoglycan-associated (lipo)protein [Spirochaeta africana DSM 8902]|uniref:Outer membrane protein/peptidoglycan-associated (Lipo)protein n=2 Tax=Spirochaeta TaxID=146 RepID=H9UJY7_SPIAZ|nr:outer membrane protein/peptidoglycan-associated (lipo)protein [Spirochaeta africana DSM 8902]
MILIAIEVALLLVIAIFILVMQSQGRVYARRPLVLLERPTVTYLVGEAQVQNPDATWQPVAIGDTLRAGSAVRTLGESRLDLRFSDGTAVRLEEHTALHIARLQADETELRIDQGTVYGRFRKQFLEQEYRLRGGGAVAGVRGTRLSFTVAEDHARIDVLSGLVDIWTAENPDQRIELFSNHRTRVFSGQIPEQPTPIPASERSALEHLVRNIQQEQVLLVSSTIQFASNTDRIMPASLPELEWVVQELQDHPYRIRIDGHTADVGTRDAMQQLSLQRAERIREYLIEQGIAPNRLQVRGFGATRPLTDNDTPEGRAINRRVEFIITD